VHDIKAYLAARNANPKPYKARSRRKNYLMAIESHDTSVFNPIARRFGDILNFLLVARRQHDAFDAGAVSALIPPTGSTSPRRLISPVIAVS
jgi:hypothetical protein